MIFDIPQLINFFNKGLAFSSKPLLCVSLLCAWRIPLKRQSHISINEKLKIKAQVPMPVYRENWHFVYLLEPKQAAARWEVKWLAIFPFALSTPTLTLILFSHLQALWHRLFEIQTIIFVQLCSAAKTLRRYRGRECFMRHWTHSVGADSQQRPNYDGQLTTQRRRKRVIRSTNIYSFDIDKASLCTPLCFRTSIIGTEISF